MKTHVDYEMKPLIISIEIDSGTLNFCFWGKNSVSQIHFSVVICTVLHLDSHWVLQECSLSSQLCCDKTATPHTHDRTLKENYHTYIFLCKSDSREQNWIQQCSNEKQTFFFWAYSFVKQLTLRPHGFLCHRRHHNQTGPAIRKSSRYFKWYQSSYRTFHRHCRI